MTKTTVIDDLKAAGPGSRFIVRVRWKSGGGHVFLGQNDNGTIRFLDGQAGRDVTTDKLFWANVKQGNIWSLRVDALKVADPERTLAWRLLSRRKPL